MIKYEIGELVQYMIHYDRTLDYFTSYELGCMYDRTFAIIISTDEFSAKMHPIRKDYSINTIVVLETNLNNLRKNHLLIEIEDKEKQILLRKNLLKLDKNRVKKLERIMGWKI